MIQLNNKVIEQNHFPDGALLIKQFVSDGPNVIKWNYENDAELFTLICLVGHLRSHGCKEYQLVMPYIPHARQDRVKNEEDVFTLKYFCEVINSLNFKLVTVLDAHSNVALALLDRVKEVKPWDYIESAIHQIYDNYLPDDDTLMLFYPDEGAMKRYSSRLNLPFAFGVKRRNWETGAIEGLDLMGEVDMIAGRNVLIIDDICSRGGTFYHAAKRLKEAGAEKIYLYITHCENTIHEGELLKDNGLIEKIYRTCSLPVKAHDKILLV